MTEWADPDAAVALMRASRLEPLEPFVDADQPWRCRCLTCGRVVTPRLSSVGAGGGCKYCATRGLDLNAPAMVFVLTHPDLNAHLIGFDAADADATGRYAELGWQVVKAASVPTVEDAYEITATVVRWLRLDRGLPSCSVPGDGEGNGSVAAGAIDAPEIWTQVSSELSRRRRKRRATGGSRGSR
jgi:hypothetical protein